MGSKNRCVVQFAVGVVLLLSGCAARVKARSEIVVYRRCMTNVELTDDSICRTSDAKTNYNCTGFKLTKLVGCEVREVKSKEKK